jgi:hypothetical protein
VALKRAMEEAIEVTRRLSEKITQGGFDQIFS